MIWYAETPRKALLQMVGDLCALAWIAAWVWVGLLVYNVINALTGPVVSLQEAGADFNVRMQGAGDRVQDLPMLGDRLSQVFDGVGGAGGNLERAGANLAEAIGNIALLLGGVIAAGPILSVLIPWLLVRIRFAQRASAAQRIIHSNRDLDLFALRALAHQPMHKLVRLTEDPAGAWRRGDPALTRALADLELRSLGLRLPGTVSDSRPPAGS